MAISKATATWDGDFKTGKGAMKPEHGSDILFSRATRFDGSSEASNPEEVIGAALAGCFSMALALALEKSGLGPQRIHTTAAVHLDKGEGGFSITQIDLNTEVKLSTGDEGTLKSIAAETKSKCPVGKLLSTAKITLETRLAP